MINAFPFTLVMAVAGALTFLSLSHERRKLRNFFLALAVVGSLLTILNPIFLIPVVLIFHPLFVR